jgi:hypothetical protein
MFGAGRRNKFMKKQNTEPVNDLAEAYYAAIMEVQKAYNRAELNQATVTDSGQLEVLNQWVSGFQHALIEKGFVPVRAQDVVEIEHPRPVHRPVGEEHVVLVTAGERPWLADSLA